MLDNQTVSRVLNELQPNLLEQQILDGNVTSEHFPSAMLEFTAEKVLSDLELLVLLDKAVRERINEVVQEAVTLGVSWTRVGEAASMSRQAASERWSKKVQKAS